MTIQEGFLVVYIVSGIMGIIAFVYVMKHR